MQILEWSFGSYESKSVFFILSFKIVIQRMIVMVCFIYSTSFAWVVSPLVGMIVANSFVSCWFPYIIV